VCQEFVDGVALSWINTQQMRYQILGGMADVVPPGTQISIITPGNLFCEDVYAFVVKRRETTEESVENTAECPHVNTFAVTLVFDNFGSGISDSSTGSHGLFVPNDLTEAKVGDLYASYASASNTWNKIAFVFLFLIIRTTDRVLGRDDFYAFKEKVFWFDVSMNDTAFFVEISNGTGDL
jgi:hypothetical protein